MVDEEFFTVSTRAGPELVVVTAVGEVDTQTATLLRSVLWNAIERAPARLVVLDASGVVFMSSGGLAVLVTAAELAEQGRKRFLVVTGDQRVIPRALHVAGLDRIVSTSPSYPDGIAADTHPASSPPGDGRRDAPAA